MKIKKLVIALGMAFIMLCMPCIAYASARYGTAPNSSWTKKYPADGYWFIKNKESLIGSNYYSVSYDYSKASVVDGKGKTDSSGWVLQDEAWASRRRTIAGTNKAYYDHKN